jgi:hypothetical protein
MVKTPLGVIFPFFLGNKDHARTKNINFSLIEDTPLLT